MARSGLLALVLLLVPLGLAMGGACANNTNESTFVGPNSLGSSSSGGGDDGATSDDGTFISFSSGGLSSGGLTFGPPPVSGCEGTTGWGCEVDPSCSTPTSLTGKVYDPAGKNPLYNVVVFIPKDPTTLPAITQGTNTCQACDVSIGNYVAATTTDYTGSFTLRGVPTGKDVPVTVQIGKWRRTIGVNISNDCATNTVSMSPTASTLLRLPRNKSEGDMPQMALLTGGCDDMACFLLNMGISSSEFGAPHSGGRIDVYQGNSQPLGIGAGGPTLSNGTAGNCTTTNCPLWSSKQSFEYYDISLFSCQCDEQYNGPNAVGNNGNNNPNGNETAAAYTNLRAWLDEGGKVFASHYNYTWFEYNPSQDFQSVAVWGNTLDNDTATGSANGANFDIDNTFTKSVVFGQWLGVVGALSSTGAPPNMIGQNPPAEISLAYVADSVKTVNPNTAYRWIYDPNKGNAGAGEGGAPATTDDVKYLSFETPIGGLPKAPDAGEGPPPYCGKAVYTDLHTGSSLFATAASVPADCKSADLNNQQKALEFLFFDLSACVAQDNQPPPPPPPPPPQ
jgi:hypothetical protein